MTAGINLDGHRPVIHIASMNDKPTKSPPPSPAKHRTKSSYIATAAMFFIVVFLWRDQSRMKSDMLVLAEQNDQLQAELTAAQSELNVFKTGDSRTTTGKKADKAKSVAVKPVEEPETLFLQEPSVHQSADGLVARFEFKPDEEIQLPEQITLVVRVPTGSDSRIISLDPVNGPSYSRVATVVNAKGNLVMIEGSPSDLEALVFELTVSAPVRATVRGTKGIAPFEIDIRSDSATVRKL